MNNRKQQGRTRSRFTAKEILGFLAMVVVLVGSPMLVLKLLESPEAGSYRFYESPILPLSSLSGGAGVEVERLVTLDFGVYEEKAFRTQEEVLITDTYILTNTTPENITMDLRWGFHTQIQALDTDLLPTITVDDQPVQARVLPTYDRDGVLNGAGDFSGYAEALGKLDLLGDAMNPTPEWDVPVKVYHFSNIAYEGERVNVWLKVSGKYGDTTNIWTRTYGACTQEKGGVEVIFMTGEDAWLYVIGDDLEDLTINGSLYRDLGGIDQYSETEGVTYELETYQSTFMECLWEASMAFTPEEGASNGDLVTAEMRYDFAMRRIADSGSQLPGGFHRMNTLFERIYNADQMIYWVFPVEIPTGDTVTVSATYRKQSNYNSDGERHGYDIATTLGSNLNFTEQRVRLVNTDSVTIAEEGMAQNMDFDLNGGVLETALDLTQERYYLDLLRQE